MLEGIDQCKAEVIISEELLREYDDVLNREEIAEKIENKSLVIRDIVQKVISKAEIVEPMRKFEVIPEDPDDNLILDCAFEGKVDFIVSQDKHLLRLNEFQGIKIVSPEEFLKILG